MSDDTPVIGGQPVPEPPDTTASDELTAKLREFGASDDVVSAIEELGASTLGDLALLTEQDLTGAGMKTLPARKLLASVHPAVTATADAAALAPVNFDAILPAVPDDSSWLAALQAGGVLKVDQSTVISAIRAALADRLGLYAIPAKLVALMEQFADSIEEQVDPTYFKLRQQLTRTSYGDIFQAIPGLDGNYVTEARKRELFQRVNDRLWPAILGFYDQLKSWQETWMQQGANPAMFMAAIASMGSGGMAMPPGMMQPPDTAILRDHADSVNDAINRVFAGTGVQITAALAYQATQIRETLQDPRLPAMIGAANREQMLRQLGVAVSSTYPRLEVNITRFILAIMQVADQPAGDEELRYFGTLHLLGSQIPWPELGGQSSAVTGSAVTGIGGVRLRPAALQATTDAYTRILDKPNYRS